MTRNDTAVTNPLTGDRLLVREFISNLVGSSRLDVLRFLDEKAGSPSDIGDGGTISRQTASKHLIQLADSGLAITDGAQDGYHLSAGGRITLDAVEACLESIDRDSLVHLTTSTHSIHLLRRIAEYPVRPTELAGTGTDIPSRSTVQRELRSFEAEEWSRDVNGKHQITQPGKLVLEAYDELAVAVEQVIEKAPWLQRLDPSLSDVPVRELGDAKLYVSSPDSPGIVLAAALKLCDPRLDRFRVLTSIFNPTLFRAYDMLLKLGLQGEAIVDASLYDRLYEEGMEHFLDDSDYSGFDIFRLEEPRTLGIGIYDDRQVAIGTYNEAGAGEHIAMILSSNDAVVEWGIEVFESFLENAKPTTDRPSKSVS